MAAKDLPFEKRLCRLEHRPISDDPERVVRMLVDNRFNLIVIGRALILTLKNVGHWYPGIMDMDTIGTPRKFSMCVAENEEASPWEPFHVEHGFSREASTVTVFPTGGDKDVGDQENSTAEGLLRTIGWTGVIGGGGYIASLAGEHANPKGGVLILIAPDHAKPIASDGFDKAAAKEYLHHICTLPARRSRRSMDRGTGRPTYWQEFTPLVK